ncbi:MAG TPA: multicopper oxidase domain-containing protein [Gemmatimonadaceae bacterium]
MSRRYSLRAPLAGAAHIAIVLSITGAKGAEPSTLNSGVKPPLARIATSDNRQPAGQLEGSTLTVRLEARNGVWYPEAQDGYGVPVAAFAEEGKPLQNPGPLIRVRSGTEVRALVRNSLDKPLTLFGFAEMRGLAADTFVVDPGAVRELRFHAKEPGTYYYAGKTSKGSVFGRLGDDSQLNGAIIVDPADARVVPDDRVFAISWWAVIDPSSPTGLDRATLVINGRSWPYTERLDAMQGDSLRWRWINFTDLPHPLHLHGFYFRVDAVGNGAQYTTYARDDQRRAVTEVVAPGGTMALAWSPTRPGNWVFHCHFVSHISPLVSIGTQRGVPAVPMADMPGSDTDPSEPTEHSHGGAGGHLQHTMSGLVLGIRVAPRGATAAQPSRAYRQMRLIVRSKPNVYDRLPGYAYVLGGTPEERDTTVLTVPGPTLVLEKDEPVAITVVNRSQMPAAVHWHGIELDSYPDGVPGWSGTGSSVLPAIAPNDSLTVRFTPPRAGTFMYHSHFDEFGQIASGLYGSIVVLDRGKRYDGETDRVLVLSDDGPTQNLIRGPFPRALLNGQAQPNPMQLRSGVTYRFRLINIRTDYAATVSIFDDGEPAQWRVIAKDGADLPPSQATTRAATLTFAAGEIYDVEFTPTTPGSLTLQFGAPKQGPIPGQATDVQVVVR